MRSIILLFVVLFTQSIYTTAFAEPGKGESGKDWKYQKKQSKEAWKHKRERERENAKDRREYERESRKHYKEMEREDRKHYEEMERENRKHLDEMEHERRKHQREMNNNHRKMYEKDRYQPINKEHILEQETDDSHHRAIDPVAEKNKPSRALWRFWEADE